MANSNHIYVSLQGKEQNDKIPMSRANYAIALVCSMTDEEIIKGLEIFKHDLAEYLEKEVKTA